MNVSTYVGTCINKSASKSADKHANQNANNKANKNANKNVNNNMGKDMNRNTNKQICSNKRMSRMAIHERIPAFTDKRMGLQISVSTRHTPHTQALVDTPRVPGYVCQWPLSAWLGLLAFVNNSRYYQAGADKCKLMLTPWLWTSSMLANKHDFLTGVILSRQTIQH